MRKLVVAAMCLPFDTESQTLEDDSIVIFHLNEETCLRDLERFVREMNPEYVVLKLSDVNWTYDKYLD